MTVILEDGKKHTVDICDIHAEDATVKSARDAFQSKKKQIDDLLAKARELGLDISQTSSGLAIATQRPREQTQPSEPQTAAGAVLNRNDDDVVPTSKLDSARGMASIGGQTDVGQVASFTSYDSGSLTDKLPEGARQGLARMTVVEGRAGQPLIIPKQRVDGTGTTHITVIKKETDQQLQSRFKRMSEASMRDDIPNFARQGYQNTTTKCTFCKEGYIKTKNGMELCPKCGGSTILPKY